MGRTSSFTIGKVTGVHGLGGNLKVWSYAQSIDTFSPGNNVLLKSETGDTREKRIVRAQPHKKGILLVLEGISNRNQAEDLVGYEILINRDQLPEPEPDTWYWEDLLGLDVKDHLRGQIGKITHIFPTGANDVLVVEDGSIETLIPMREPFVENVDLEGNLMHVRLPEDY